MKSLISKAFVVIAILGVAVLISNRCYGQARPSPATQVISIDPLTLAQNFPLTFQYEYKTGPIYSWALRLHYWPSPSSDGTWSGFGVGGAYRIYIADSRALTGLSVAPAADLFFFRQTLNGVSQRSAIVFDLGGDLEYKWIFDQFSVEPSVGFRIGFGPTLSPSRSTGASAFIGLSGGYAW